MKVYNTMNKPCEINPKYIVGHYTLPFREMVNGEYVPQYKLVMVNGDTYYVECSVFDKFKKEMDIKLMGGMF